MNKKLTLYRRLRNLSRLSATRLRLVTPCAATTHTMVIAQVTCDAHRAAASRCECLAGVRMLTHLAQLPLLLCPAGWLMQHLHAAAAREHRSNRSHSQRSKLSPPALQCSRILRPRCCC